MCIVLPYLPLGLYVKQYNCIIHITHATHFSYPSFSSYQCIFFPVNYFCHFCKASMAIDVLGVEYYAFSNYVTRPHLPPKNQYPSIIVFWNLSALDSLSFLSPLSPVSIILAVGVQFNFILVIKLIYFSISLLDTSFRYFKSKDFTFKNVPYLLIHIFILNFTLTL